MSADNMKTLIERLEDKAFFIFDEGIRAKIKVIAWDDIENEISR